MSLPSCVCVTSNLLLTVIAFDVGCVKGSSVNLCLSNATEVTPSEVSS